MMAHPANPGATNNPIRVIIVDDHPLFREGLEKALSFSPDLYIIGQGADGEEALELVNQLQPDVIILDISLPKINGIQAARRIHLTHPKIPIVILTAYDDTQQIIHAMRAGASAYCAKDIDPDELIRVVHDVTHGQLIVRGQRMTQAELEQWINHQINHLTGHAANGIDRPFIPLSPRETQILSSLADGKSNKEIARDLGISQQTVKNHITSILQKLNVKDRTQAVIAAVRHGWVRITTDN